MDVSLSHAMEGETGVTCHKPRKMQGGGDEQGKLGHKQVTPSHSEPWKGLPPLKPQSPASAPL